MTALTNSRQEIFVQNWFKGETREQSAITAGYAPRWARSISSRLSTNVNILARYNELQQKVEDATISTERERRKILTQIERATIADFVDEHGNLNIKDRNKLKTAAVAELRTERTLAGMRTTLKLRDPVGAITEHNKMEHVYETESRNVFTGDIKVIVVRETPRQLE